MRTLIALHHGRKTKSESFAICRGRVNISGGSEIAWINVECNGDSLSVAVPSKVKMCLRACAAPVIPLWQIRCLEATEEIQKESKLQPCPRIFHLAAITLTANGCGNNIKTGNRPLTWKRITKRQRPSNTRTIFRVIHIIIKGVNTWFAKEALRLLRLNSSRSTFNKKRTEFQICLMNTEYLE